MRARGPLDAVTGVMGDVAGGLRRRREARRPYARVYDATGAARTLTPGSQEAQALIEAATAMVEALVPAPGARRSEGA